MPFVIRLTKETETDKKSDQGQPGPEAGDYADHEPEN